LLDDQHGAAGGEETIQRVDPGNDVSGLDPRDCWLVNPRCQGKLTLCEPCSSPRFSNDSCGIH
jgi:hypothetical protein